MPELPSKPLFFASGEAFRKWLARHHARAAELWVGFYNRKSGRKGITYKEALDQALCYGWIDGVRKSLDEERYVQRFTPRRAKSYWSRVNVARARALEEAGLMAAPGRAAFEARDEDATARYSFEREQAAFDASCLRTFRAHPAAWAYFQGRAPYYRRVSTFWVMSAKKEETRQRRLAHLIERCAKGLPIGVLESRPPAGKKR